MPRNDAASSREIPSVVEQGFFGPIRSSDVLSGAAERRVVLGGVGLALGGGRIVQPPEHLFDDGAPPVADQMQHVADLKVAEALHQSRKHEHADDDHDPHEKRREQRDLCRSAAVHPGEREQGVDERRGKRAERVRWEAQ